MKADTYREHLTDLQLEVEALRAKLAAYQSTMGQLSGAAQSTKAGDLISRAAAIDAVNEYLRLSEVSKTVQNMTSIQGVLRQLPSAQPEPLTDKEQRIFLAAMGREEKVCKQVDAECRDCREPYEDSLVSTCHEITRKVKGALWT